MNPTFFFAFFFTFP
ncbi:MULTISPECIES: hypothetical protein [Mixta]